MAYRRAVQPKKQLTELRGITKWPIDLGASTKEISRGSWSDERYCSFSGCSIEVIRPHTHSHTHSTHINSQSWGWGYGGWVTAKVKLQADNEDINMTNDNSQRQNSPCPIAHHINLLNTPINNSKPKAWPTGQNRPAKSPKPQKPKAPTTWPSEEVAFDTQPYISNISECWVNYEPLHTLQLLRFFSPEVPPSETVCRPSHANYRVKYLALASSHTETLWLVGIWFTSQNCLESGKTQFLYIIVSSAHKVLIKVGRNRCQNTN